MSINTLHTEPRAARLLETMIFAGVLVNVADYEVLGLASGGFLVLLVIELLSIVLSRRTFG